MGKELITEDVVKTCSPRSTPDSRSLPEKRFLRIVITILPIFALLCGCWDLLAPEVLAQHPSPIPTVKSGGVPVFTSTTQLSINAKAGTTEGDRDIPPGTLMIPSGVELILTPTLEKFSQFEDVVVSYCWKNNRSTPIVSESGKSNVCLIEAWVFNYAGIRVPEMKGSFSSCKGYLGGTTTDMLPGEKRCFDIPLRSRFKIDAPGRYQIILGNKPWFPQEVEFYSQPVVSTQIEITQDSSETAEQLIQRLRESDGSFAFLKDPVYIPALRKEIERDNLAAVDGLASIDGDEAVAALIDAAQRPQLRKKAVKEILNRIPKKECRFFSPLGPASCQDAVLTKLPVKLNSSTQTALHNLSESLLKLEEDEEPGFGAQLLGAIANTAEDGRRLVEILTSELVKDSMPFCSHWDSLWTALLVWEVLVRDPDILPMEGDSIGDDAVFLLRSSSNSNIDIRSLEHLQKLIVQGSSAIRQIAAETLPSSILNKIPNEFSLLLSDADCGVRYAACHRLSDISFSVKKDLNTLLRSASDLGTLNCAVRHLKGQLEQKEIAKILISRFLKEEDAAIGIQSALVNLIMDPPESWSCNPINDGKLWKTVYERWENYLKNIEKKKEISLSFNEGEWRELFPNCLVAD